MNTLMFWKLMRCAVGAAVALAIPSEARAEQLLYSIDFASPFHEPGQPATLDPGGAPRQGPSRNSFQTPTVVDAFGPLTEGALRFASPSEASFLSQIELAIESPFDGVGVDAPEYRFSFDLVVDNFDTAADNFSVLFDSPMVNFFLFRGDGLIQLGTGANFIGSFSEGDLLHVSVAFMTDRELWRINVNGSDILSGALQTNAQEGLKSIRLSLSDSVERGSAVFVDNIEVRAVPSAPTAVSLLIGLLLRRRNRRR